MKNKLFYIHFLFFFLLIVLSCESKKAPTEEAPSDTPTALSDDSLMTLVQQTTFNYFWEGALPNSGMAPERIHLDGVYPHDDAHVIATGGSGFGLMALIVGMERGFISPAEGIERFKKIITFLEKADRFHGAWSHWIDDNTGKVVPFGKRDDGADIVETSFLIQGLLCVRQYLAQKYPEESALVDRINTLWQEVEWNWFTKDGQEVLFWHWSPRIGWEIGHEIRGYNECLITYALAACSPTHPISPEVYHKGWARDGKIVNTAASDQTIPLALAHNGDVEMGGPLFWAHYSYLGLNPEGLKDQYADYWQHNVNHTLLNRQHCIDNPHGFKAYGPDCWGLTASYTVSGYSAHSPKRDVGVISPTAALSSTPYTPEYSLQAMRFFYEKLGDRLLGKYGFYDAFSLEEDWFPNRYLAIDQGPIVGMIENHRTGLLWKLFMSCPEVQSGLDRLGFTYSVE